MAARLKPWVALIIGTVLVALTVAAFSWSTAQDPARAPVPSTADRWCPHRGLPSLALAGTPKRAATILACPQWRAPGVDPESAIRRNWALIAAYVALFLAGCLYGSLRARRSTVRRAGTYLAGVTAIAGLCDVGAYLAVRHMVRGHLSAGTVDWAYGLSLAHWVLMAAPAAYTLAMLVGTLTRFWRTVAGAAAAPGFVGDLPHRPNPTEPPGPSATDEERRVARFRPPGDPAAAPPAFGVCLSGGGIRAASVAMGAVTALQRENLYDEAECITSVSGGGYLAGAAQFVRHAGAAYDVGGPGPFAPDTPEIGFVTANARYLWSAVRAGHAIDSTREFVSGLAWALAAILFNVGVLVALIYSVTRPIGWALHGVVFQDLGDGLARRAFPGVWIALLFCTLGLGPIVGAGLRGYVAHFKAFATPLARRVLIGLLVPGCALAIGGLAWHGLPAHLWWGRHWWAHLAAVILIPGACFAVAVIVERDWRGGFGFVLGVAVLLLATHWLDGAIKGGTGRHVQWGVVVDIATLAAALLTAVIVAALARLPKPLRPAALEKKDIPKLRVAGATAVLAVVASLAVAIGFHHALAARSRMVLGSDVAVWAVVAGVLGLVYAVLDQKRWSLHPIYKYRLAGTFSPMRLQSDGAAMTVEQLPYSISTTLSTWGAPLAAGPRLLVCAAAYDTRRATGAVKAWPFVFAHDYVGSAEVGWTRTVDFEAALGRTNARDGTLMAAMAISGAAISPGLGQIRLGSLNAFVSLFNLRLGVWLPSPRYVNELRNVWPSAEGPALRWLRLRRFTYLLKEIAGVHDPEDRFVYVTDGGQFDNLGLVELLTRRCRVILAVDASGDRARTVNTFEQIRGLAWDRYGVTFTRPGDPPPAPGAELAGALMPDLLAPPDGDVDDYGGRMAKAASATVSINYPAVGSLAAATGTLVFVKAALVPTLPPAILAHAATRRGRKFPKDSTADQWPDAGEFLNYVALGDALTTQAIPAVRAALAPSFSTQ